MNDVTDEFNGYLEMMFERICDDYGLESYEIKPEDHQAMCKIISRFVDQNTKT